ALGNTIRSMRVMLPDGSIERVSRTANKELFDLVVGGYGLFGIIVDVELEVTENVIYASERQIIDYQAFPALFEEELASNPKLGLMYGHLSTSPGSLLREMLLYTYEEIEVPDAEIPPLGEVSSTKLRRFVLNFSKQGSIPMRLKWFAEKHLETLVESCTVNRNQAMKDGEACLVSRNEPMHDSVKYLQNSLPNDTDILQEYFIPRAQFVPFVDGLRQIIIDNDTTLLNASVRVVHQEENFLNYAPADMFSVVLYINQGTAPEDNERMGIVTRQIIDLATSVNGTFFLPYQLHYTPEQLQKAYPNIGAFFEAKRRYDPERLLTNTFYDRYAGAVAP
nr:FAD-binding oxidoreductase [Ardenticatenales bacterium]